MTPFLALAWIALVVAAPPALAIFIGPQTREGFTDVGRGILDAIHDLQTQFRHTKAFTVVATAEAADLQLLVVGRRTAGASGSVGVPIGAVTRSGNSRRRRCTWFTETPERVRDCQSDAADES